MQNLRRGSVRRDCCKRCWNRVACRKHGGRLCAHGSAKSIAALSIPVYDHTGHNGDGPGKEKEIPMPKGTGISFFQYIEGN